MDLPQRGNEKAYCRLRVSAQDLCWLQSGLNESPALMFASELDLFLRHWLRFGRNTWFEVLLLWHWVC